MSSEIMKNFQLTYKLGEGTYGTVMQAIDLEKQTFVAIKFIKKKKIKTSSQLNHIRREINLLAALNHPNIVKIYKALDLGQEVALIMEYIPGTDLFDSLISRGKYSELDAKTIFRQLVCVLSYLHENSIVHRDLKPENIMIDGDLNIKLIDFGFVKEYREDEKLNTVCGSIHYSAPEVLLGHHYCGYKADIWSLGICLYVLIMGHFPFPYKTIAELKVFTQSTPFRVIAPESPLKVLLQKMITVNPTERASISDIWHDPWVNPEQQQYISSTAFCMHSVVQSLKLLDRQSSFDLKAIRTGENAIFVLE